MSGDPDSQVEALRAEHDRLAERLAARRSVDDARKAAYGAFFSLIATGLSLKLAWDRWFSIRITRFKGPPVFFFVALAVTVVLLALTIRWWRRSRRLMRDEDAEFARMRALRDQLRLDP